MPSDSEFVILEEYIATMKLIIEITEATGRKNKMISTVRPLIHNLLEDYLKCKHLDSKLKKDIKNAMADNFAGQYVQSALMFLNVSTFLDPRFKLSSFLTDKEMQPLLEFIEAEVIDNTLVMVKKGTEELMLCRSLCTLCTLCTDRTYYSSCDTTVSECRSMMQPKIICIGNYTHMSAIKE